MSSPTPKPSSPEIRRRFQQQLQRDTKPEQQLRQALVVAGHRGYRTEWRLPGTRRRADIAWPGRKVAVFVDGCFWHRCPEHGTAPRSNADWWQEKLESNVARDRDTDAYLEERGWAVIRVWEHEEPGDAARRIAGVLKAR